MSSKNKKHTAEIVDPGLGELDKVRKILFGRQTKAYEDRFAELESSLNDMITNISDTVEKRLAQLELDFNEREEALKAKLHEADVNLSQGFSDVRGDMDNITAAMGTDIAQIKGEFKSDLQTVSNQMLENKNDRELLAMMFDEMSMRLRNKDKS